MRVVLASCMFAPVDIITESYAQMQRTMSGQEVEKYFLNQHWPIKKASTIEAYKELAKTHGAHFLDAGKNLGLHHGYNYIFEQAQLKDEDVVICYDPDLWPLTPCWDLAMVKVFSERPEISWIATKSEVLDTEVTTWKNEMVGGVEVSYPGKACVQSLCAFRWSWLKEIGGFDEPSAYYGGLECHLWSKLGSNKVAYLQTYRDQMRYFENRVVPAYRDYKWAHAHLGTWKGDFESYLQSKHPELV